VHYNISVFEYGCIGWSLLILSSPRILNLERKTVAENNSYLFINTRLQIANARAIPRSMLFMLYILSLEVTVTLAKNLFISVGDNCYKIHSVNNNVYGLVNRAMDNQHCDAEINSACNGYTYRDADQFYDYSVSNPESGDGSSTLSMYRAADQSISKTIEHCLKNMLDDVVSEIAKQDLKDTLMFYGAILGVCILGGIICCCLCKRSKDTSSTQHPSVEIELAPLAEPLLHNTIGHSY
jgi:hypothetical protein